MTIEMPTDNSEPGQGPFIWPAEPKDYRPWGKEQYQTMKKSSEKERDRMNEKYRFGSRHPPEDGKRFKEKTGEMLKGVADPARRRRLGL